VKEGLPTALSFSDIRNLYESHRYIYIREEMKVKKGERREAEMLMSVCNPRCGELPFPPNAFYEVTEG